jgi:amino acid adenylation domain-containing protein
VILAIWRLRAVYIPVDRDSVRTPEIINDVSLGFYVVELDFLQVKLPASVKVISIDSFVNPSTTGDIEFDLPGGEDLAYSVYTSGSTGKPKGAMVTHEGMLNHLVGIVNCFTLQEDSIFAQTGPKTFDISIWQFLANMVSGHKVIVYDEEVVKAPDRLIERITIDHVSVIQLVPSYISVMLALINENSTNVFKGLKYLVATGEALSKRVAQQWFENFPVITLVNAYGPTEASDDVTIALFDQLPEEAYITIGRPIQNASIYIMDDKGSVVEKGNKGELWIEGIGVGRGYLNNPALTEEKFPVVTHEGVSKQFYKTGDLARIDKHNNVKFLGRMDDQVKLRGNRFELQEVINCIVSHENVLQASGSIVMDETDTKYLVSHIVVRSIKGFTEASIKNYLRERLPVYMVPDFVIVVNRMPVTSAGKIHREKLPIPHQLRSVVIKKIQTLLS